VWHESSRSKIMPRNLVSSTTGTGVPFRSRVGSGWCLRNLQKCMHTVLEQENLNPCRHTSNNTFMLQFCLQHMMNAQPDPQVRFTLHCRCWHPQTCSQLICTKYLTLRFMNSVLHLFASCFSTSTSYITTNFLLFL